MKRLLLVAVLAVATSLFATAPALAESAQKEDICACYDRRRRHRHRLTAASAASTASTTTTAAATSATATPTVRGSRGRSLRDSEFVAPDLRDDAVQASDVQADLHAGEPLLRDAVRRLIPRLLQARAGDRVVLRRSRRHDLDPHSMGVAWKRHRLPAWDQVLTPRRVRLPRVGGVLRHPYACGPTKHPWVRIVFYDNNTLTKDAGVNWAIVLVVVAISVVVLVVIQIASGTLTS